MERVCKCTACMTDITIVMTTELKGPRGNYITTYWNDGTYSTEYLKKLELYD